MPWQLKYETAVPELPGPVAVGPVASFETPAASRGVSPQEVLPGGCWALRLTPRFADDSVPGEHYVYYEGTIRVQWTELAVAGGTDMPSRSSFLVASGDLYLVRGDALSPGWETPPFQVPSEVPVYPIADYRFYLRLESAEFVTPDVVILGFSSYRLRWADREWSEGESFRVTLQRDGGQAGGPAPRLFRGPLTNDAGTPVADVRIGWASRWLRQAKVEIDKVEKAGFPPRDLEVDLDSVFRGVDWEFEAVRGDRSVAEPDPPPGWPEGSWSKRQLHAHMLRWRSSSDLDGEWLYHLFIVCYRSKLKLERFGQMYDSGATDSNLVPREGAVVAWKARFPDDEMWGHARGKKFGKVPEAFLRTVVHEIGHAMGLTHNYVGRGFMQSGRNIARQSNGTFPRNIDWRFHPDDAQRLRHLPDIWVRPGGLGFESRYGFQPFPLEDYTLSPDSLALEVAPVEPMVPLGAPVRLEAAIHNLGAGEVWAPKRFALGSGLMRGEVFGPGSSSRRFGSVYRFESASWEKLAPGDRFFDSVCLSRGVGALFPSPGVYRIEVEVVWEFKGRRLRIAGGTTVMVSEPVDDSHRRVALEVLSCREIVLPLVFRSQPDEAAGDMARCLKAYRKALKHPVLGDHFAAIEARSLAERPRCLWRAAKLITESTVMSQAETRDLVSALEAFSGQRKKHVRALVKELKRRGQDLRDPELRGRVGRL